ncbi:MAG: methionyl-tRNA formyltransferase [Acidobacteriota bacterium]|nr:methionyl-tRNA formyltransferase [Acidobacteriota bacterium]
MRLLFMGTPGFAVPTLRRLLSSRHRVSGVFTQPDRPAGRGRKLAIRPVKQLALLSGLPVHQPDRLAPEDWKALVESTADVLVVVAYGKILPRWLFTLPPFGAINVHASLLPRYRGAAPIPWAIVRGETRTGVTTMKIDRGMDTGDVLLQKAVEIGPEETSVQLGDRLAVLGAELLADTLDRLEAGLVRPRPQDPHLASYAPMLKKSDGEIDWSQSSRQIFNRVRAFNPWPGAFTRRSGSMLRILKAQPVSPSVQKQVAGSLWRWDSKRALVACGEGWLELLEVQPENHRALAASDFLNGLRLQPGHSILLGD